MPNPNSGEIQMYAHKNNDMAVSPIVATLVLIVVAVIGAVAVGTIMGSFSSDVSKKASAGQAGDASSTDILIAGSTTIQPAMLLVANDFMTQNPGVKLNVQAGGSGAGLASVAAGVANIGMFSQKMDTAQIAAYPTVKEFVVGYGGVVAIVPTTTTVTAVNATDLKALFNDGLNTGASLPTGITTLVIRSDVSGTADSFATMIGARNIYNTTAAGSVTFSAQNGNGDLVKKVAGTANSLGFTDLDYALTTTTVKYLPWDFGTNGGVGTAATTYTYKDVRDAKNGMKSTFPSAAVRPLELLTLGNPDAISSSIIQFTQSPTEAAQFHGINLVHVSDIVTL